MPDEVVRTFAAVGRYDEIAGLIADRFGGVTDTVTLGVDGGDRSPGWCARSCRT